MRESPCQAIRASRSLAEVHPPFAKEMFNVAFVSCWADLFGDYKEDLTMNLQAALSNNFVPPDVVNIILSLAEFMEHDEKALAIDAATLGDFVSFIGLDQETKVLMTGKCFPRIRQSPSLQGTRILYRDLGRRGGGSY
jgi:hypothetical protein